jgi:hypothetical protein
VHVERERERDKLERRSSTRRIVSPGWALSQNRGTARSGGAQSVVGTVCGGVWRTLKASRVVSKHAKFEKKEKSSCPACRARRGTARSGGAQCVVGFGAL